MNLRVEDMIHKMKRKLKDYKKNPENYAGSVADAVKFVRFAITGRVNTPELYTIMKTISKSTCISRLNDFISNHL